MERLARRIGWRRVIVTAACLVAWRAMGQITIVPVRPPALFQLIAGGTPTYSIIAMGVAPYINTVILFTVVRTISKTVRTLSDDEAGRRRLERWIRGVTVVLAAAQAYSYTTLVSSDSSAGPIQRFAYVVALTAGTMALILLSDVLDEHGVGCGYGVYVIYFAGFLPRQVTLVQDYLGFVSANPGQATYQPLELWLLFMIGLTAASVVVLAARRVVPAHRKRRLVELQFPLVISGVLRPALLANAVMALPSLFSSYFNTAHSEIPAWFVLNWTSYGPNRWGDALYTVVYAGLVLGMACFVVAVDFSSQHVDGTLRSAHVTIDEGQAGGDPARFLRTTAFRLGFAGGLFLAVVLGVLPVIFRMITEGPFHNGPTVSTSLTIFFAALVLAIAAGLQKPRADVLVLQPRVL